MYQHARKSASSTSSASRWAVALAPLVVLVGALAPVTASAVLSTSDADASPSIPAASKIAVHRALKSSRTFRPPRGGELSAVEYRQHPKKGAPALQATVSDEAGTVIATARFKQRTPRMATARFAPAVRIDAGTQYTIRATLRATGATKKSDVAGAADAALFAKGRDLKVRYKYDRHKPRPTRKPKPTPTSTPTPTPTPTPAPEPTTEPPAPEPTTEPPAPEPTTEPPAPEPSNEWPNADNTGVPAGVTLQPYTGPCTFVEPATLDGVDATGRCSALLILAPDVVIKNSRVPRVDASNQGPYSVKVIDSNVVAGNWIGGAVWGFNITVERSEVTGGQHNVHCNHNCVVTDSWLHSQYNPDGQGYHNNAFISNGGANMVVRHNTLHCDAILNNTDGGCTGDLSLFGDFEPIKNVTIDNNLFKANNSSISYCLYGGYAASKPYPVATGISVTNNVFERGANSKCGVYGPVTGFQTGAAGNVWSNNTWTDGASVAPEAG